jgi:hypothetical protein
MHSARKIRKISSWTSYEYSAYLLRVMAVVSQTIIWLPETLVS